MRTWELRYTWPHIVIPSTGNLFIDMVANGKNVEDKPLIECLK